MNLNRELQAIFDEFYEDARRKYVTGWNRAAVDAMEKRLGRRIISTEDFSEMKYFWPYHSKTQADLRKALYQAPCFLGTGSGSAYRYCLYGDAVKAARHFRRPVCWTCGKRYRRPENAEQDTSPWGLYGQQFGKCTPTAWSEWSSFVYVEGKGFRPRMFDYPTCSKECNKKAAKKLAREIVWLKTAREKQMEVRRFLRNNRAA